MDLKIESRHVQMKPKWKDEIQARAVDLHEFHPEVTHTRVQFTRHPHHRHGDDVAEVLIVVNFPRRHTITARKEADTFEEAMRAAFTACKSELKRFREKRAAIDPA